MAAGLPWGFGHLGVTIIGSEVGRSAWFRIPQPSLKVALDQKDPSMNSLTFG